VTLIRKHQRLLDIEDRVHDKQASSIATAVKQGMIEVITQFKVEEKVKIKEEEDDTWRNLMSPMTSRRHSADSLQHGGARARPPPSVRLHGGANPVQMTSKLKFDQHFPPPLPNRYRPDQSLPGQRAQMRADHSRRVNSSEEKAVIGLVQQTFCPSPSVRSDTSGEMEETARRKLQITLSKMADDPAFEHVDLQQLLNNTSWTVKTKGLEY